MAFFELVSAIGIIGTCFSFATVMYIQDNESVESKIADGSTIFFAIISIIGILGYFL